MHFMHRSVAISAERDEILSAVVAQATSGLDVVDLKIFWGPAHLATPTIPRQDFFAEQTVLARIKFQPWYSLPQFAHLILMPSNEQALGLLFQRWAFSSCA
jgi:hypothetical protein